MSAIQECCEGVRQFLDELRGSRLLNEEQLAVFLRTYENETDVQKLGKVLLRFDWLTPFQIDQIQKGQGKWLVIGPYRVIDELGEGGFGRVFKATHSMMDRVVALKVIAPEHVGKDQARSLFRREILATTRLCHPNIVTVYDANEIDETIYMAMEFIDGPTLDQYVEDKGPLPILLACDLMHQTARALQYAHERGMVHRDVKPGNLLLKFLEYDPDRSPTSTAPAGSSATSDILVKVVDFGFARLHPRGTPGSHTNDMCKDVFGTPGFIAPEQACDFHNVDIRSDLYSLGCTFYYALTGVLPFDGTFVEVLAKHLEEDPVPVQTLRPEVPLGLASILRRLMAKKPEKRFQTPAALMAELDFFHGLGPEWSSPHDLEQQHGLAGEPIPISNSPAFRGVPRIDDTVNSQGRTPDAGPVRSDAANNTADATLLPQAATVAEQASTPPISWADGDATLRDSWNQWFALVATLAAGRKPWIEEDSYRAVHKQLLRACRTHAERSSAATRGLFQHMEALMAPWVAAHTLTGMDRGSLRSLEESCRLVGGQLGLLQKSRAGNAWLLVMLLVVAALAGATFALFAFAPRWLTSGLSFYWK